MSYKVVVHLYDLSQGLAKQLSMGFLGKQIDGIWHTGLVVYGKEYYFGGGICSDPPGMTPYGSPIQKIEVGETEIPQEVFLDFLKEVKSKFTIDTYDLFENNCNNFTDTCCDFLIGQGIPSYITGLPKEVLATPFGQMIKPMVDGFTQQLNQNSHPIPQMYEGSNNPSTLNFNQAPVQQPVQPSPAQTIVEQVTSIEKFFEVLDAHPAVIVDFYSLTCPPCIRIKPFFEKLAQEYQKKGSKVKFIAINTQAALELSMQYNITAIPTFIGFYDALQVERFSGADPNKIENLVRTLDSKVNNTNGTQETKIQSPTKVQPSGPQYNIFNPNTELFKFEGDAYALPINSVKSTLDKFPTLNQSESKAIFVAFAQNPQTNAKSFPANEKANLANWILDCISFIEINDKVIGFLDLLKMLCLDADYANAVVANESKFSTISVFFDQPEKNLKDVQKGLRLVLLRLLTNVTSHDSTKGYFQLNLNSFVKQLLNVGKLFKDEKPALFAVLMILWNLTQSLTGTKELDDLIEIIVGFAQENFASSSDNEVLGACIQILSWVSFNNKKLKSSISDHIDRSKLTTLSSSTDSKLAKRTKDLLLLL